MFKRIIISALLLSSLCSLGQEKSKSELEELKRNELVSNAKKRGYTPVSDLESLFNQSEIEKLQEVLVAFKKETGVEIAVFTLGSEFTPKENFEKFTLDLANFLPMNAEKKMSINISKEFRRIRIHNSDALMKLISDEETKSKADSFFITSYKEGKYFEGTFFGVKAMMDLIRSKIQIPK